MHVLQCTNEVFVLSGKTTPYFRTVVNSGLELNHVLYLNDTGFTFCMMSARDSAFTQHRSFLQK